MGFRKALTLPLHTGRCPSWLYPRMKKLTKAILTYIFEEYGEEELIKRISNPFWFQSLSNVIGFDWHSSGTTTTTTSAIKESLKDIEGIASAGGKGKTSLKTPEEIEKQSHYLGLDPSSLIEKSRLTAKIDNSLIQDGYTLYHHFFIFTKKSFAVIQQGMNTKNRRARRYHWYNNSLFDMHDILGLKEEKALVLTGAEKERIRKDILDLCNEYDFPKRHEILSSDLSERDLAFFKRVRELSISNFKELLLIKGMGEKKIRSLALISSLIYGDELDWNDPVKYSFAHGGKDGIPYPVDKKMLDENTSFLEEALINSKLEERLKKRSLRKLYSLIKSKI